MDETRDDLLHGLEKAVNCDFVHSDSSRNTGVDNGNITNSDTPVRSENSGTLLQLKQEVQQHSYFQDPQDRVVSIVKSQVSHRQWKSCQRGDINTLCQSHHANDLLKKKLYHKTCASNFNLNMPDTTKY